MRWLVGFALSVLVAFGQGTATISGRVTDGSGAVVAGAQVLLENSLTGYRQQVNADEQGQFAVGNIPFQTYRLTVRRDGFAPDRQDLVLRSNVPVEVELRLTVAELAQRMDVAAQDRTRLVEPDVTGTRSELNMATIERMPLPPGGRGLESVLLSFPGFAANANGAIHPRGAHNQMTFVVDGMPISDQLTGAFANAVDPSIVQTVELHTGNVPAEFGNKVSGVAVITTRTGMGSGRAFSGSTQVSAARFDTLSQVTQVAGGTQRFGYFGSVTTLKSNRYLDAVSLDNLQNGGNLERSFGRLDYHLSPRDQVRASLMAGRSSFQLANLRSQHANGQQQRQLLKDASLSLGWVRTIDARSTVDVSASYRGAIAQLLPSAGDTPVTASQARHLTTVTVGGRYNRVQGRHNLRMGADQQWFPVRENFTFGVTDPGFNQPGTDDFRASLLPFDLTRGGRLFQFSERAAGTFRSAFVQDTVTWGRFVATLGARYDQYRFLVDGNQLQPRLGVAYHLRETGTVLRASYNRTYQTPPNENLLLSNSRGALVLVPDSVREAVGGQGLIRPERQNVYEVGLQQAMGRLVSLNAAYYHKDSRDLQDNDNFLNTGIIFPTSLLRARVNGAEARVAVLPVRGLSGSLSLTHYRAIVTPPFTGGLFLGSTAIDALSAGPFVIDHDQSLGAHGMVQWTPRRGWWVSTAVRYDSGLVSNPSNPVEVRNDPDYADLLPYVNLDGDPPRVRPRTITDVAVGYERLRDDRKRWDVVAQVSNLTNQVGLYNFQSVFVGTRVVQPRAASVKVRLYF